MDGKELVDELRGVVGTSHVLIDPELRRSYETGWMGRWSGESTCVVRPETTDEVAEVVRLCGLAGTPIVPQGGNTGLVGGSVPGDGRPVVMSLRRMSAVGELSPAGGHLQVGAGTTLEEAQQATNDTGWSVGIDLAARGTATIGGMIATNAGGLRVLRDGSMRRQVLGLEFVTGSGAVVSCMRGLVKDNTGYDLVGLMCGSEGTLGIMTRALLQLVPHRPYRIAALVGLQDLADGVEMIGRSRPVLPSLESAEYVSASSMSIACSHGGLTPPFEVSHGGFLLLECAARYDPTDELASVLANRQAVAVGADNSTRARLWRFRETLTEAIAARGIPHKVDISVPLERLPEFEKRLTALVADTAPNGELFTFGHIADGNLHVNVVTPDPPVDDVLDEEVLRLTVECGGSVSAEHGIGRAKTRALAYSKSATELATMRAIKRAFDPEAILNPGVLFSSTTEE